MVPHVVPRRKARGPSDPDCTNSFLATGLGCGFPTPGLVQDDAVAETWPQLADGE